MKNKKKFLKFTAFGFTLIELLGVLIILAVIALITFPIIDKILLNAKEEAYERQKYNLIEAARLYITNRADYTENNGSISFDTLINEGFLKAGEILDPRDSSKKMPGCVIYNWSDKKNQYIFEYSENCVIATASSCFTYKDTSIIESFDINYDACMTYFTNLDTYSQEDTESFCKGGYAESWGSFWNLEIEIALGYVDTQELKNNNVISNVVESKGLEITGYDSKCGGKSVIVPKNIDGEYVISIGEDAFYDSQLTSVTISDSVKTIGDYAFAKNKLASVIIPNSVKTVGDYAFESNQLTSAIIGNRVAEIGDYAFARNQLTSVTIPNSVTIIEEDAFAYNELTSVTIPNSVITIQYAAFNSNQLQDNDAFIYARNIDGSINENIIVSYGGAKRDNVIIPDGATTIEYGAFAENQLTSVTIPNSVITIGAGAFYKSSYCNSNLTSIVNKTGRNFNWGLIINNSSGYNFETGTVVNSYGNVEITK